MKKLKAFAVLSLTLALWPAAAVAQEAFYSDIVIEDLHSLTVTGDTTVEGDLQVDGNSTLTGNIEVGGTATVTGTVQADGSMSVNKGTAPDSKAALEVGGNSKGFLPPRLTTAQRDGIASPPEGLIIFNIDTNTLNQYTGAAWQAVGSGSGAGVSLITGDSFNFEGTVGDWLPFDDGTGASPVGGGGDFSGGSPTFDCDRAAGTEMDPDGYLLLTHTAADEQGQGCSILIDIPAKYRGQRVALTVPLKVLSGTYAADQLGIYLYDFDNTEVVPGISVLSGTGYKGNASTVQITFDTKATTTQVRLAFYEQTTTAVAYTVGADDILLGPNAPPSATPISSWTSYVPTISAGFGTATNVAFQYKRIGDTGYIRGTFTAGTVAASVGTITLPSGWRIDTSKINSTAYRWSFGNGWRIPSAGQDLTTGTASIEQVWVYDGTNTDRVQMARTSSTGVFASENVSAGMSSSENINVGVLTIPLAAYSDSGNIATSERYRLADLALTRVTGSAPDALGEYRSYLRNAASSGSFTETNGSPGTAPSVANGFRLYGGNNYETADTNNEPTRYEIFVGKGKHVEFQFYQSAGRTGFVDVGPAYVLGTTDDYGYWTHYDPSTGIATLSAVRWGGTGVDHNTGRTQNAADVEDAYFDIIVSDNPIPVQSEPALYAVYQVSASTGNSSFADNAVEIVDYDTLVSTNCTGCVTTGASWKFTAPRPVFCMISSALQWTSATNLSESQLWVYKNSSQYAFVADTFSSGVVGVSGGVGMKMNRGDTFDIRALANTSDSSARTIDTSAQRWTVSAHCQ